MAWWVKSSPGTSRPSRNSSAATSCGSLDCASTCWKSEGDAAEVTQDVFFTVWRTVGKFRGDSSFSTWLYRVATNHCLKFLRRGTLITVPLRDQAGSSGQPEGEFEARQTSKRVSEAVAALTPEQRCSITAARS